MSADDLMKLGLGGAALVGLLVPPNLGTLAEAARLIETAAEANHAPELLTILRMLSEGRYTARELEQIVPAEVVMGSSLIATIVKRTKQQARAEGRARGLAEGRAEGRAAGRAEGEVVDARLLCTEFVRQYHPEIAPLVTPVIAKCSDVRSLRRWALAAPMTPGPQFVALLVNEKSARGTQASCKTPSRSRPLRAKRR